PMLDRVFHEWLQQHAGHDYIERCRIEFLHHLQLFPAETHNLDVEIVVDKFQFFPQRPERLAAAQQPSQDRRELENHVTRRVRIEASQRRKRVQGIEQEVGIDRILQGSQARMQQKALLLLQLDLKANAVEDLDLDPDRCNRRGIDQCPDPKIIQTFNAVN